MFGGVDWAEGHQRWTAEHEGCSSEHERGGAVYTSECRRISAHQAWQQHFVCNVIYLYKDTSAENIKFSLSLIFFEICKGGEVRA
jgi:hypothetical protein